MSKGKEDGISALPDCLLLEILSRLPSTKYAIRTGTLSKRWVRLWTWLPTLIFKHSELPLIQRLRNPKSTSDYVLLVDETLNQCHQSKLKKFEVQTYYDIRFESKYSNWIRYAISCNVEKLNLEFWYTERQAEFRLDESIFVNSCFTDLRLVGCKMNPTGAISWKNLRSLCISHLNLDEELIVNILSGSPLLETLVLEYCYGYMLDDITPDDSSDDESETNIIALNDAFKSLSLAQYPQLKLKKFEVVTRFHIQFESQLNSWIPYAIRCNVKELNIMLWNTGSEYEFMPDQYLFTSSCLTQLTLCGCLFNSIWAISKKNLRSLDISFANLNDDLIENILSGSPVLETLVVGFCYGYRRLDITSKSVKNLVLSDTKSVKNLVLSGYRDLYNKSVAKIIEIDAPNILSLSIQQNLFPRKFLLLDVSSLVKATLNYTCPKSIQHHTTPKEVEEATLREYIMNLRHVKEIEIGFFCSKAFSHLQAKGFIFPSNVKFQGVRFEKGYQGGDLAL